LANKSADQARDPPGGDGTKEERRIERPMAGRIVDLWMGGELRAARQYFHFALIIPFSFSSARPSPVHSAPRASALFSSSQSELAARQMKIYRSPPPRGRI